MLNAVSVDFGTIALLAVVVWLDGWRRLSPDTVLVTRSGFGPWTVRAPYARIGPFALVALWAPITMPVLIVPPRADTEEPAKRWGGDFGLARARAGRRLRRAAAVTALLRALGVALTAWIIVGIPVVTARFGAPGLIQGVAGALLVSVAMTFGATISMTALGVPCRRSIRSTAQLLSPFTAPRAAEIVTSAAVGGLQMPGALAALLGEDRFGRWIRPWAYDTLAGEHREIGADDRIIADLVRTLPRPILEDATSATPHDALEASRAHYCPRCTRVYRDMVTMCGHCDDVSLVAIDAQAVAAGTRLRVPGR